MSSTVLYDKTLGCLLGGLIGDAMGAPTEQMHYKEIESKLGWVETFDSGGTDDTLMKTYLANALIRTQGRATLDDWAREWKAGKDGDMFGGQEDRFFTSVVHAADKLRINVAPREVALGNMASSSSAMAIAPVGIVNACDPWSAALQAYNVAGLIHIHDVAFCQDGAAAIAAAVAEAYRPGASVDDLISVAIGSLLPESGKLMIELIEAAVDLARSYPDYTALREQFYERESQFFRPKTCDSRETIPITFALLVASHARFPEVITYAANFGRDSDTIASMAGAVAGALNGAPAIPTQWVEQATAAEPGQEELARALVEVVNLRRQRLEKAVAEIGKLG